MMKSLLHVFETGHTRGRGKHIDPCRKGDILLPQHQKLGQGHLYQLMVNGTSSPDPKDTTYEAPSAGRSKH